MIMRKVSTIIAFVFGSLTLAYSQQITSSFDGLILRPSSLNDNSFYYGEPFNIYFEILNAENVSKKYYKPQTGINYKLKLINLSTGRDIHSIGSDWYSWGDVRKKFASEPPSDYFSYKANEYLIFDINSGYHFGIEWLSNTERKSSAYNLKAVPIGQYELFFEYYLFPSNEIIKSSFRFEVKSIPNNEKAAFDAYVRATEYAFENNFWNKKSYNPDSPDTYEHFINKFPSSVYSEYAFLNMMTEIYHYPIVNESIRQQRFNDFADKFSTLKQRKNVQAAYVISLPSHMNASGGNLYSKMDSFLVSIKKNDPILSKIVITISERTFKIKGLKNYAADNR